MAAPDLVAVIPFRLDATAQSRQLLMKKRRAAEPAIGHERVVRNVAYTVPACAFVKSFSIATGDSIEYENRFASLARGVIDRSHQPRGDALSSRVSAH